MEKTKLTGILGLLCMAGAVQASVVLDNTGLGAQGTVDPNYTLVDGYSLSTGSISLIQYTSGSPLGTLIGSGAPWAANPPGAQWISPYIPNTDTSPWLSDASPYTYEFQTVALSSGTVSGVFGSDNAAEIYVNGQDTGIGNTGFNPLVPFTLTLTVGSIVDFYVDNYAQGGTYGNPAGLIVDVTSTVPAVPEPSTILSGLLLAMPFGASTLCNVRKNIAA